MSKLYPPIIAGTIPAFYGDVMKVPFQMNRAVSNKEVKGFYLKIKTVQNSRLIGTVYSDEINIDYNSMIVSFRWDFNNHLNIGQHYKIQIAYVNTYGDVGHYSTVGVVKYTSKPKVEIQDLVKKKDNIHRYSYLGVYAQERFNEDSNEIIDVTEKLYSYCFNLYDVAGNLIHTSDWQIHNSTQDTEPNMAICSYVLNKELNENQKYYIEFEIITSNELHGKSGKYSLIQKKSVSPNVDFDLVANAEEEIENGGIVIGIRDNKKLGNQKNKILRTGSFKLMRADEESEYTEWSEILAFKLFNQVAPFKLFTDYTIKQGIKYKYAIIQYNDYELQSNKIESNIVSSDFEHIYLFDGKRQLKIKYNPKISSFKEILLESKINTIGAKHPFIFRNGNIEYKEFPISGLITSSMDENYLFFDKYKTVISPKNREYINNYIQIEVSNKYIYYYPEEWNKLYVKERRTENIWLTVKEYCDIKKIFDIKNSYNSKLIYAIKDPENNGKYLELSHDNISSNEKIYYYDQYKNNLYIRNGDEYIKHDINLGYLPNETYYLSYAKTKQISNLNINHFITSYNSNAVQTERDFKLEVLDWLNNGQPKLFRSPTEGNYIVRLMNSSLIPNEQLGRVLHTFNSTAYEVDEYNFDNLLKNEFITTEDPTTKTIKWETVRLDETGIGSKKNLLKYKAVALRFEGMIAGDRVYIDDGILRPTGIYKDGIPEMKSGFSVVIGITGSYNLDLSDNIVINQVCFEGSIDNIEVDEKYVQHQGTLTYAYESAAFTSFDTIETFKVELTPLKQFHGKYDNVINEINNIKNQLQEIYFIHAKLRDQYDIYEQKYYNEEKEEEIIYYTSAPHGGNTIILNNDRNCFYRIFGLVEGEMVPIKFYDGYHFKFLEYNANDDENSDIVILNDQTDGIRLFSDNDFFLKNPENIYSIQTGHRVLLEICYQSTITNYGVENDKTKGEIVQAKDNYNSTKTQYETYLNTGADREITYRAEEAMNVAYKTYIHTLELELERQGGIEGELVES